MTYPLPGLEAALARAELKRLREEHRRMLLLVAAGIFGLALGAALTIAEIETGVFTSEVLRHYAREFFAWLDTWR